MRSYYKSGGTVKKKRKPDNMPARNKKNFRPTKSGAGMTRGWGGFVSTQKSRQQVKNSRYGES
jgi:hypothetical protein